MDPDVVRAVVLGIVQGLTEFFPVSSTAHLILFPWFFGWSGEIDTLAFDVSLHAGTLVALLVCFYQDWITMILRDRKKLSMILIAMLPAGVAGVLFHEYVEHTLRNPLIIVFTTVIFGILMLVAERRGRKTGEEVSLKEAVTIGIAQAVALIPGVSRSGITITAGLFQGLTREAAARFSFLLSTPVIGGAALLEGRKLMKSPELYHWDVFTAGFIASFLSGLFAIRFLLAFLRKHPLDVFVYYRFALAAVIVALWVKMNGL